MTVQDYINDDLRIAMRNKNVATRDLLRVVIGEFNRIGKVVSNEKATAIIKKMRDNAVELDNKGEVNILELYLPEQMSEDELSTKINEIIDDLECTSIKDMGSVMMELKATYGGEYDGKQASTIVKEFLIKIKNGKG